MQNGERASLRLLFELLQLIERQERHHALPALAVYDDLVGDPKDAARIGNEVAKSICRTRWFGGRLPAINDARGHTAVLALFDKALAAA